MSMARRFGGAAVLLAILQAGAAAQIMRFETNVGSFDMTLNPTNDPNLQPLVIAHNGNPTRALVCTRCRRTQLKSAK